MNNINTLERRLKDAQRIKKYLIRNNASETKISEIKRIENFLDVELNKEKIVDTCTLNVDQKLNANEIDWPPDNTMWLSGGQSMKCD